MAWNLFDAQFGQHQSTALNRAQKQASNDAILAGQQAAGWGAPGGFNPMTALQPFMGTAGTGAPQGPSPEQQAFQTWQTQQANAAAGNTAPQGGYGDSAIWGNYLRQAAQPGGLTGAYNPLGVSPIGGLGGGGGPDQRLEEQRQLAFAELERQRAQYESPQAQELQGAIMAQLRGQNSPWGAWEQGALADAADAGAGQWSTQQDLYNQQAANAGVKVGGRMAEQASRISGQGRKARRDITSTRATQEDARRERAQGAAAGFLRDKAQATWAPTQANVGLRSRFEVTGQGPFSGLGGGGGGGAASGIPQGGMDAMGGVGGLMMANGQMQSPQGSFGGVSIIPGLNSGPWSAGGSSARNNQGGGMGLNLSNYDSYANENTAGMQDWQRADHHGDRYSGGYASSNPNPTLGGAYDAQNAAYAASQQPSGGTPYPTSAANTGMGGSIPTSWGAQYGAGQAPGATAQYFQTVPKSTSQWSYGY